MLQDNIESGIWREGEPLPSEAELQAHFGVSRTTVRRALNDLCQQGLVVRRQGKGTFAYASRPKHEQVASLSSFTEIACRHGQKSRCVVIALDEVKPLHRVAEHLKVPETGTVMKLHRLRYIDERPASIETSYLPLHVCDAIDIRRRNFESESLYEVIESAGIILSRGVEMIEAIPADGVQSSLLGVAQGAPLLSIDRLTLDDRDEPVEYIKIVLRGDMYRRGFEIVRSRPGGGGISIARGDSGTKGA